MLVTSTRHLAMARTTSKCPNLWQHRSIAGSGSADLGPGPASKREGCRAGGLDRHGNGASMEKRGVCTDAQLALRQGASAEWISAPPSSTSFVHKLACPRRAFANTIRASTIPHTVLHVQQDPQDQDFSFIRTVETCLRRDLSLILTETFDSIHLCSRLSSTCASPAMPSRRSQEVH